MFYCEDVITPMSELLVRLIDAYNSKQVITLKDIWYDYSTAAGKIHFILSGSNHKDGLIYVGKENSIPVIRACNYTINSTRSFALCSIDYDKGVVNLVRIGQGESRVIELN